MVTEVVPVALPAGLSCHAAPRRPRWLLGGLVALGLAGCGGGDFAFDAASADAPAAAAVPAAPPAAGASAAADAPVLSIRRQPRSVEVRAGSIVLFGVDVEGPGAVSYQWLRDDQPMAGETGAVLQLSVDPADHLARISVIVSAGRRSVRSDAAVLRVAPV